MLPSAPKPTYDIVNTGIKICFKKAHKFSMHPDSGGGPLGPFKEKVKGQAAPAQDFVAQGLGQHGRINLSDFICSQIASTVYCRYGLDHLKPGPKNSGNDIPTEVGSFKIDIDALIYSKQRHIN
jgi:hypothetical protein